MLNVIAHFTKTCVKLPDKATQENLDKISANNLNAVKN